jgi:hypothetical protein
MLSPRAPAARIRQQLEAVRPAALVHFSELDVLGKAELPALVAECGGTCWHWPLLVS